jgi:cell division septal protein FtsQ
MVGSIVGPAVLVIGSVFTPLFGVRHVRVTVDGSVPAFEIRALAGLSHPTLMVEVHPAPVTARLDADPWLGGARVAIRWPGTVTVTVTVRAPIALVATSTPGRSGWAQIDATGRVLADGADQSAGVPVIQVTGPVPAPGGWLPGSPGPRATPDGRATELVDMTAASDAADVPGPVGAALAVLAAMPAELRADIQTVTARPGVFTMVVDPPASTNSPVTVEMGDGSQLAAKASALAAMLQQADLSGVSAMDLSVPDRPSLTTGSGTAAH